MILKKLFATLIAIIMAMSSVVINVYAVDKNTGSAKLVPPELKQTDIVSLQSEELESAESSSIEVVHDHTIDDIVNVVREYENDGLSDSKRPSFAISPHYSSVYDAGELSNSDLEDAMNALKTVRYLAGVPYSDIVLDGNETNTAQHKAVLMAASEYSHHPYQPSDMDDDFYNTANTYNAECIAAASWKASLASRVISWITDTGANNIGHAGHRMILLNPGAVKFGFGYANNESAKWSNLYAAHVRYSWDDYVDSYVAWPNAGNFPIQYFVGDESSDYLIQPWSLSLGTNYKDPERDDIELTLTRKRDNKVWNFNDATPEQGEGNYRSDLMHLSVNGNDVLFRPDLNSLGEIKDGDIFNVKLTGIQYTDGSSAELSYDINFFDLEEALTKSTVTINVKHNGTAVSGATVLIGGQTLITDSNGSASARVKNNQSYTYTINKSGYTTASGNISVGENAVTENVALTMPVTFNVADVSRTYNGTAQGVTVYANPNVAYRVTYNGSETVPQNAGRYNVSIVSNAEGYSGSASATITIDKAALSIKADDKGKKIGNADPELTYTITSGQLYGSDTLTGALSRRRGEALGTYNITQGNLSAGDNYNINFIPATFTILEKTPQSIKVSEITDKTYGDKPFKVTVTPDSTSGLTAFTYESDNTNVADIAADGTVTIKGAGNADITVRQAGDDEYAAFVKTQRLNVAKAQLTVTADNKYKKIGTDDPALTYTYTGTLVGTDVFSGALARQQGESLGKYDILQGTLAVNNSYDIAYNKATFEIVDKTPQNISVSQISEKTYGDAAFKVTATQDSVSGLNTFTYECDKPDIAEIAEDGTVTIKAAGEANITVKQAGDEEYAAFANTQKLVVKQKEVTVTAMDLDAKTAALDGVLEKDSGITLDFSTLKLMNVTSADENNSNVTVSGLALQGDGSANYKVTNESINSTIKNENLVTVGITAMNGTVTGDGVYIKGSNITVTAAANSGYTFTGWSKNGTTVSSELSYGFTVDENTELTANFRRRSSGGGGGGSSTYTVKFETNGGNAISNKTVNRNTKLTLPENPTKEGYTFGGWYTDKELTKAYDSAKTVTGSMTLYAKWIEEDPQSHQIILTIGKKDAAVFGRTKSNDVAPKIVNDRTMLPARFVAENLGAKVEWIGEEQKVRITKGDTEILIFIGSDKARVNNKEVTLDSPAFIENDRTYTPIRFISEELGASVDWNGETQEVTITQK